MIGMKMSQKKFIEAVDFKRARPFPGGFRGSPDEARSAIDEIGRIVDDDGGGGTGALGLGVGSSRSKENNPGSEGKRRGLFLKAGGGDPKNNQEKGGQKAGKKNHGAEPIL